MALEIFDYDADVTDYEHEYEYHTLFKNSVIRYKNKYILTMSNTKFKAMKKAWMPIILKARLLIVFNTLLSNVESKAKVRKWLFEDKKSWLFEYEKLSFLENKKFI
jgi:hypothetical protein